MYNIRSATRRDAPVCLDTGVPGGDSPVPLAGFAYACRHRDRTAYR